MSLLKGGSARAPTGTRGRPNYLQALCTKLSNNFPHGDNVISSETGKSFIAIAQGFLRHFEQSHNKALTPELRNVWTGLAPWSMHIFDHCIISCREEIHLQSFEHAPLMFYILRLLEILSSNNQVCRDMASTPNFISKFTKAWMCLLLANPYRLPAMTVIKRFVSLNETAFISSIDSYANQLPLSALLSLEEEFSLKGRDMDYAQLHCVLHSVHQIVRGSRRESVFCTTLAAICLLKITCCLCRMHFSRKRIAHDPDSKNKCDGALCCLVEGFAFFARLVGRMKYTIIGEVLRFGLFKVILCSEALFKDLSEFPKVQEAHAMCRRSWKTIFTKLRGSIICATLEAVSQGQWLPLVHVAERYISLYERMRVKRVCNLCGVSEGLVTCSKCHDTFYCSIECQRLDYRGEHKEKCKKYECFASAENKFKAKHLTFFTRDIVADDSQARVVEIMAGQCEFAQKAGVAVRGVITILDFTDGLTDLTF
ncbi:uncharacterized protein ARMOST_18696 [Armillaria ostoyae]|uniref:MYND-type domain-containing protein n=1 Tax=Armillaria ostoyae TaxID=47428 RepID=A0A284S2H4_ARMOS|nr:uncharacterized protein ARMOST_18696 [Armillaria ostoyae]